MTARQQSRVGRRLGRDRTQIDATPAPSVADLLHAARDKKGVDLYRAERDTKIRARHLAALESGDYDELPGAVYAKGFLRNYAVYLGLDPVEILDRWRDEQDPTLKQSSVVVEPPPQPMADPRRGLTFTPGLLVAAALTAVVILFSGYVVLQLARFSQVPQLTVDGPQLVRLPQDRRQVTLTGMSVAGATVDAQDGAGHLAGTVTGGPDGRWDLQLPVGPGQNDFTITSRDPETGKVSPSLSYIAVVDVPATPTPVPKRTPVGATPRGPAPTVAGVAIDPGATPEPSVAAPIAQPSALAAAGALAITSPEEGARSSDATVAVRGTTDADEVRLIAAWAGEGREPRAPESVRVDTRRGAFSGELVLPPGRWAVSASTVAQDGLPTTSQTRTVDVSYNGLVVTVGAQGSKAWIEVWIDGERDGPGRTYKTGDRYTVTARRSVIVNTGYERSTVLGVQGEAPTHIGNRNGQGVWLIEKGEPPVRQR